VDIRGVAWQIYNAHLQHNDAAERRAQAEAVVEFMRRPLRAVVLLGDLNATPGTLEIRVLTGTLVDAWQAAHSGPGGTFPSPLPFRRIDYVMRSRDGAVRATSVSGSIRARLASEHLAVVADLVPPANGG
jgi:endonuclease/exonuclease/phosphatase family metal-dependent hydrolase